MMSDDRGTSVKVKSLSHRLLTVLFSSKIRTYLYSIIKKQCTCCHIIAPPSHNFCSSSPTFCSTSPTLCSTSPTFCSSYHRICSKLLHYIIFHCFFLVGRNSSSNDCIAIIFQECTHFEKGHPSLWIMLHNLQWYISAADLTRACCSSSFGRLRLSNLPPLYLVMDEFISC